ncbi:hypothetical protein DPEC_G00154620 [Dallia pectoralis]|uniref:Uncharacterized protein n=1 Tax=Dallia pectoralis TaxID=75939 RepID=A0ACC2GK53_DALPE|nr:hypothetical protein DPEC_G00154620 [Dallia pectoralis]
MMLCFGSVGLVLLALDMQKGHGNPDSAVWNRMETSERNYYTRYHNMTEISEWMEVMERENPDVVSSMIYGQTYEKRNITLLKIGLSSPERKKAIWMDCGIHAREWIAPAFCQYFVNELLRMYKTDTKVHKMMKNLDFFITPVVNVDGYTYSWLNESTRLWRKSRSPGPDGCTCYGTDLNRNFNANWGTIGVSTDCCEEEYGGTKASSEPETQAVTDMLDEMSQDLLAFITIHCFGQFIIFPYGNPNTLPPNYNELMAVGLGAANAIKAVHGMRYTVISPDILYPASGLSQDYARQIGIPLSFTFELRDTDEYGFILPEDLIQPTCEEAYVGVQHIISYAHDKAFYSSAAAVTTTLWTTLMAVWVSSATLL